MAKILSQYFTDSLTNHVIIHVDPDRHATEKVDTLKAKFTGLSDYLSKVSPISP